MRSNGAMCSERASQVGRDGAPGHDSRATMSKDRSGKKLLWECLSKKISMCSEDSRVPLVDTPGSAY